MEADVFRSLYEEWPRWSSEAKTASGEHHRQIVGVRPNSRLSPALSLTARTTVHSGAVSRSDPLATLEESKGRPEN